MIKINMDLFEQKYQKSKRKTAPLADRMRPKKLEDFIGQEHILGGGKPLRKLIEQGQIQSIILWGPPGCGKTTLARLVAKYTKSHFSQYSAVTSGINEIRAVIKEAQDRARFNDQKTILFIDEIHRFNKAQQDGFLPFVEDGTIILVGATTENPGFEINAPLISRSQVYTLNALEDKDIELILNKAIKKYYPQNIISEEAEIHLIKSAGGDARVALNGLELAFSISDKVDLPIAEEAVQKKAIYYDKKGDWHYDTISAFIKSLRGSDPNAAIYWLARMLKAGEDPMFIARRMVILASEDIGNADPQALILAISAMQAVHMVGMPEAQLILSQTAAYLATAPKSNACYLAIKEATKDVEEERLEPVPVHLRNAPTKLAKELGHGKDYKYPHNYPDSQVKQQYLPNGLAGKKYYRPRLTVGKKEKCLKGLG